MKHILLTTTLALTLLPLGALAQNAPPPMPPGPPPAPMFAQADLDHDGKITKSEAQAHRGTMFDKMDADGDGFLSDDEKRLMHRKHQFGRRMHHAQNRMMHKKALDTDKDGSISQAEFMAGPSPFFDRMDTNKDGTISVAEHAAMKQKHFARMDVNGDGVLSPDDRKAMREQHKQKAKEKRAKMDLNKDGRISRDEFITAHGTMFTRLDANKDGVITHDEAMAGRPHHAPFGPPPSPH